MHNRRSIELYLVQDQEADELIINWQLAKGGNGEAITAHGSSANKNNEGFSIFILA